MSIESAVQGAEASGNLDDQEFQIRLCVARNVAAVEYFASPDHPYQSSSQQLDLLRFPEEHEFWGMIMQLNGEIDPSNRAMLDSLYTELGASSHDTRHKNVVSREDDGSVLHISYREHIIGMQASPHLSGYTITEIVAKLWVRGPHNPISTADAWVSWGSMIDLYASAGKKTD